MDILVQSLYYDKGSTGVAKYSEDFSIWLADSGHRVEVICAVPHYPKWLISENYRNEFYSTYSESVSVNYVPVHLPKNGNVNGIYRVKYEILYTVKSLRWWFKYLIRRQKCDIVIAVEPALLSIIPAVIFCKVRRIPLVIHVQDLQVDAASGLGIITNTLVVSLLERFEKIILKQATIITTITEKMAQKIVKKTSKETVLFPNWSDVEMIYPINRINPLREELKIDGNAVVILYSGNMGDKQGLEIVIQVADMMKNNDRIKFVMCGDGGIKPKLVKMAEDLDLNNVKFIPLQPLEKLNELLALGDIHLIIQKRGAADIVMPSKLTNIAASGRPVIATADPGTNLYESVVNNNIGTTVEPENPKYLYEKILEMADNTSDRILMGLNARNFATINLDKNSILPRFNILLHKIVQKFKEKSI